MSRGRGREVSGNEEQFKVRQGRRAPYTQLGDWVMLAPIRDQAKVLYWALSSHLPVKEEGDSTVNPTMAQLAEMLGYSRRDKVSPYFKDLVAIDAIEIETDFAPGRGNVKRNTYVVHQSPPEDYEGHESLRDFYRARKARQRRTEAADTAAPKPPKPVDNSALDTPQSPEIPGPESTPNNKTPGGQPYPKRGTGAVPETGYGKTRPINKT